MTFRLNNHPVEEGGVYIDAKIPPSWTQRINNPQTGPDPRISDEALIHDTVLGPWTQVGPNCYLSEVTFGAWSYIVNNASAVYAEIGKFCSLANGTCINPGNHPHWRAAMHHFAYRTKSYDLADEDYAPFFEWRRSHKVTLGHDIWCGHGAIILPGRTIGTGAVIAAGAVVTHDVPPFTIVGGTPARPIRPRFDAAIQDALLEIAWWDWDHDTIKARLADFQSFDAAEFVEKYRP